MPCANVSISKAGRARAWPGTHTFVSGVPNRFPRYPGSALPFPLPDQTDRPFDFRSQEFCDAAERLMRVSGCSLVLCRQELFIAWGDVAQAHTALLLANCLQQGGPVLH